jgi:hypothetical protein
MSKLIICGKTEHCITIQSLIRDKNDYKNRKRSNHFYFLKEEIEKVFEEERTKDFARDRYHIIARDGYSFADIYTHDGVIEFQISWLENFSTFSDTGRNISLKGEIESIRIDYDTFYNWYYSDSETLKALHVESTRRTPKFTFYESKRLKEILANDTVRKKFIKRVLYFKNYDADEIKFYDDFVDYSFEWCEWRDGQRGINGGLIFHKDYDNPEDLAKGYYGVHT